MMHFTVLALAGASLVAAAPNNMANNNMMANKNMAMEAANRMDMTHTQVLAARQTEDITETLEDLLGDITDTAEGATESASGAAGDALDSITGGSDENGGLLDGILGGVLGRRQLDALEDLTGGDSSNPISGLLEGLLDAFSGLLGGKFKDVDMSPEDLQVIRQVDTTLRGLRDDLKQKGM